MKRRYAGAACLAMLLAGCATARWTHPNKTAADFQRDAADCAQAVFAEAVQRAGPRYIDIGDARLFPGGDLRERDCLRRKHGWSYTTQR